MIIRNCKLQNFYLLIFCCLLSTVYCLLFLPNIVNAEVVNLAEKNKIFLQEKVNALRQTELWRISRGRLQPNPVTLQLFTIYQVVITSQEYLLNHHNQQFGSTLARLRRIETENRSPHTPVADLLCKSVFDYLENELLKSYLLENSLRNADSMMEIWKVFDQTIYGMESIPTRAELALSTLIWMQKLYGDKEIPDNVLQKWNEIMKKDVKAGDAFTMNEAIDNISAEYSRLISTLTNKTGG